LIAVLRVAPRDGNVKAAVRNLAFLLARILIDHFRDNALHFLTILHR